MKRSILAATLSGAVIGGIVAGAVLVTPRADYVSRSTAIPLTSPLRSPGPDYFWESVPLGGGRGQWVKRPAGHVETFYTDIGVSPSNQW